MKKWTRKPFTKAILSIAAVGMSVVVSLSAVMLVYQINDTDGKIVGA